MPRSECPSSPRGSKYGTFIYAERKICARANQGGNRMSATTPVGSIISSLLDFPEFMVAVSSMHSGGAVPSSPPPPPPPIDPSITEWVPADGRAVNGSAYQRITGRTNVPDLRGLFLRGLNNFDPQWTAAPVNPGQLDPDGGSQGHLRVPGAYQGDGFASHNHGFSYREPGGGGGSVQGGHEGLVEVGRSTQSTGISETRAKNAAVSFYVCIN